MELVAELKLAGIIIEVAKAKVESGAVKATTVGHLIDPVLVNDHPQTILTPKPITKLRDGAVLEIQPNGDQLIIDRREANTRSVHPVHANCVSMDTLMVETCTPTC